MQMSVCATRYKGKDRGGDRGVDNNDDNKALVATAMSPTQYNNQQTTGVSK